MANSKLPVEQNLDSSLVADGYEGIGHDHNLAMDSSHNSGSGDLHMGTHGNPNLGWEHANGDGLELGYTKENHIAPQNPYIHQVKDDGEYLDRVDNPAGVNNLNGDIQAYDNQLALSHHLALSENHEMTNVGFGNQDVAENVDVNMEENQERSNVVTTESVEQAELVLDPPVLQIRSLAQMENHELTIGQEFPDAKSCRRAVRNAAIALRFEVQTFKSDKTRFTAKCATEGCPWRIHAAKLPGLPTFSIRTIHDHHTCVGIAHLGHQQASVQWVADTLAEHIKQNPQCKPKEILEEIHRVHGITLSYKQAWRGKERIMAAIRGSFEEDYRLLPQYCDQVQKANPGSIALVYSNPNDGSFQHLFISFQASIYGFLNACRPLIGLDKTCLKSKDLGSILLATGFDGEGAVFPLAFAVVDEENDDNWTWFLFELHKLLEINTDNMPKLTILSNRKRCIVDGVEANFPTAFHGFCLHYLAESFHKEFNNSILLPLFWEAAAALTVIEFETKILEIQHISPTAALWIQNIPYTLWATSHFEGKRFGHLTDNVVESLNTWISETSGLPIIQMIESIRRQMMSSFNKRRETSLQWTGTLVPSAERHVFEAVELAQAYQVIKANEAEFQVITDNGSFLVDIRIRHCLCRGWQLWGLPCTHAVAALLCCRQNVYRFTESCFTVANYRRAYSQSIYPVPDKRLWKDKKEDVGDNMIIRPPKSARPPGWHRKRRHRLETSGSNKRAVHCSRCNQAGHFRTTCPVSM